MRDIRVKLAVGAAARSLGCRRRPSCSITSGCAARSIVDLAPDAGLLLAEGVVFGRSAMGETLTQGCFSDRWRVRRSGALVFAETLRLDGAIAQRLAAARSPAAAVAIASVLKIPAMKRRSRPSAPSRRRSPAKSAYRPGTAWRWSRLVAPDGAALRRDLIAVLTAFGNMPLPRLWLN